jgi:hypothetical protein
MPNTNPVVNEEEEVTTPDIETPVDDTELDPADDFGTEDPIEPAPTPAPGDKTPPNLLLKSLQEERAKNAKLEEENQLLKSSTPPLGEAFSDEGRALESHIIKTDAELAALKEEMAKKDLIAAYPVLKDKWDELEIFRLQPDNAGMSLQAAAKVYLVENGMFDKRRRGVEKPTGGTRTPATPGTMTVEEVEHLRKNDANKYRKMLKAGQIQIAA